MVLIGSFRLEESLGSPRVASLNQRIAARCYIDSWTRSEVEDYIQSRMQQTMETPSEVFQPGAIGRICEFTGGVPRVVNQLCDHALVMAASKEQRQIDEFSIDEAWADLQRLPLPENHLPTESAVAAQDAETPTGTTENESIVEFGSLEDETFEDDTYRDDALTDDNDGAVEASDDAAAADEPVAEDAEVAEDAKASQFESAEVATTETTETEETPTSPVEEWESPTQESVTPDSEFDVPQETPGPTAEALSLIHI